MLPLLGRPVCSLFTPILQFCTSVPEMYRDNQTLSWSFCSTIRLQLMGIQGVHCLPSPFPTTNLPQGSFGNRVSNGRGQWLDMSILKLELAFWLLTSLCLAQPYGIRVKVNNLPKSKQRCPWQCALYKENTKLIAWT